MKAVEILGREHVPDHGTLVAPNRLDHATLVQLERLLQQRGVTYLVEQGVDFDPGIAGHLERAATIWFSRVRSERREETRAAVEKAIASGSAVVFVPSPAKTRPASISAIPSDLLDFVLELSDSVLPLFVDHPRETRLAIESSRSYPERIFSFGKLLEGDAATPAGWLESLLGASERSFSRRPLLECSLPWCLVHGLKKFGSQAKVIDGMDGSELRFDKLLAAAIALSRKLAAETSKPRIGIILPPGKGAFVANLAALLAGKTPVNLNFTAGQKAVESAIRQADLDRFMTADPFVRKMQKFPWPPNRQLIFLERVLPHLKGSIVRWLLLSKVLPAATLCKLLKISPKGGRSEATLMFTSGSSGEPKGVIMSHRNLLANVTQFSARLDFQDRSSVLGCLPIFHCFGATVTMWFPMLEGHTVVTYPLPTDPVKLAELVERHRLALLATTPTFLRGFLRKVKREQLASLQYAVVGAEKLPSAVGEAFEQKFGKVVLEGYGLTETAPVTNVNVPDPVDTTAGEIPTLPALRKGSVGQPMPGLAIRITDHEGTASRPISESGMIWFRGANIFEGYLDQPARTDEVLQDGWFRTGDIGRVDADGFLYIEGRITRFSKIGGEMVPHETVEAHVSRALGLDNEDERRIAVVGVPDAQKGEQLILLSTVAGETITQELIDLRYTLLENGVPALWIPKRLVRVEDIPLLASGKLDIRACEKLAINATS